MTKSERMRALAFLCLGHFLMDTVATFNMPLLPLYEGRFQLAPLATGAIMVCSMLTASFTQPLWGTLSDRMAKGRLVVIGPMITCIAVGLVGLVPSYGSLLLVVAVSGLGVAAFHPEATALAGRVSAGEGAVGLSLFVVSGHLGLAGGPALSGWLAETHGIEKSWWLVAPGLLLMSVVALGLRPSFRLLNAPVKQTTAAVATPMNRTVWLLLIHATVRAFAGICFTVGLPFLFKADGMGEGAIGRYTGIFMFAGGVAGFSSSYLLRRGQERPWLIWTSAASLPACLLLPVLPRGGPMILGLIVAGATLNATVPMALGYAQRQLPGREGFASSLMLGVSWGLGGALAPPVVRLFQDRLGEAPTLQLVALCLVATAVPALLLPRAGGSEAAAAVEAHYNREN